MAVSSAGSIDAASMAAQLVAAERKAPDARLARIERQITAQVSAVGTLRSAFSALRTAVNALGAKSTTDARSVSLANTTQFTATAGIGAATGRFSVEVQSLAAAQKLRSAPLPATSTTVGTGTLTFSAGGRSFDVTVDADGQTLEGLRDAINAAAGGKMVQASIVTGDDGAHLVLTALDSGTAHAVSVSASGGDGGLERFTTQGAMSEITPAADAVLVVDGIARTSSSNTVTDLLPGVTFNLKAAAPGAPTQMTVQADPAARLAATKTFVGAYNASLASIATTTSYNTTTQVAAALNGDAMVRGVARELRDMVGADVNALKSMGITIAKDGTLTLDEGKFQTAVVADPGAADALFGTGTSSLATRLDATLDRLVDSGGLLDSRSESLTSRTKTLTGQRDALDRRMTLTEARYKAQFIALDAMITKLQSTSNFLTQQLSSSQSAS